MIEITVTKLGDDIITIEAKGHSGYAESGSDIICSAVSALTQNCEKGLKELLKINTKFVLDERKPYLCVSLPDNLLENEMHDAQIILKSTYLGLKDLANSEPKYICLKEKRK